MQDSPLEHGTHAAHHPNAYQFGNMLIAIQSNSTRFREMMDQRFTKAGPAYSDPIYEVAYSVGDHHPQTPENLFKGRKIPVRFKRIDAGDWQIEGHGFSGRYHAHQKRLAIQGPLATYPVDLACLALWYDQHPNGIIVHAAGLRFGDDFWLCAGPSGAGKTTLTRLFPENALCEEFCGILVEAMPKLTSLPFWSERHGIGALAGIYLLHHAATNQRSPIPIERCFRQLAAQVFWPYFDNRLTHQTLFNLVTLLQKTDIYDLGFSPTTQVAAMFQTRAEVQLA